MEKLKNFEAHVKGLSGQNKTIILEMIKEIKASIIKEPLNERQLLINLHDEINKLVIGEPENQLFRQAKSFMDNLVETLR